MFKFARKTEQEEEKLAVAIARSLSLQAAVGGAENNTNTNANPSNPLGSPKVEVRKGADSSSEDLSEKQRAYRARKEDKENDAPPPLPELSMKVGNKTPGIYYYYYRIIHLPLSDAYDNENLRFSSPFLK